MCHNLNFQLQRPINLTEYFLEPGTCHRFNLPMGGEGGIHPPPPPKQVFQFSCEWEELLFQTKFLSAASSLGHLSIKELVRSDLPSWPKIRWRGRVFSFVALLICSAGNWIRKRWHTLDTHLTYPWHTPAASQSCYSKTNRFSCTFS